jgi:hypothetical protein
MFKKQGDVMLLMKREEFKELLSERKGPCVSIFMPTIKGSEETKQNPIMFRKLLREAGKKLVAYGLKTHEAGKLLAPTEKLQEDHMFWQYQSGGLAVFLSETLNKVYTLPLAFKELTVVADHFCVTPVIPLFAEDGRFCVLSLNQHAVKLYQCSRYTVAEVDLRQMPKSITDLLELSPGEKQLEFHGNSEGRAAGPGRGAIFHGHAEDSDEEKDNIRLYFQTVNKGINAVLGSTGGPLVLHGVDYLTRIYEKANTYPNLRGRIGGGELKPEELREMAWKLVSPVFDAGEAASVKQFAELEGTPRASNHLKTILKAAEEGKVATLMVSSKAQRWAFYDQPSGILNMHKKPDLTDTELLDLCAIRTLHHGGQVYVLEPEKMPGAAPAAAIFRY